MFRSICVPLDGSAFAEHALPYARTLAQRCNATLHLVTVSPPLPEVFVEGLAYDTSQLQQDQAARHQLYIDSLASQLKALGNITVRTTLLFGDVATNLCDLLQEGGEDLVVMATHGRSPLGRFWLGSVADEMVRHTCLPLLLVRPTEEKPDLGKEISIRRVILALDGTPQAEAILNPVQALFEQPVPEGTLSGEVVLMRAVHSVPNSKSMPDVEETRREAEHLLSEVSKLQRLLESQAREYLEGVADRLRGKGLSVCVEVVAEDQPAEAILREAEKERADLIAMETHGRSGLSRLLLGSVADKVIRGARVPVLLHRPVKT